MDEQRMAGKAPSFQQPSSSSNPSSASVSATAAPSPSPAHGFHMLEPRTIALADGGHYPARSPDRPRS
ncbi:hypothetical protein AAC387_Pa05g3022 [Persea americana]